MKEKRYIHRWMLAPVLACLLLATASCSKDATETEAVPSPGGTYLTIVTRGINTTDENEYEDYVGKLRVMAFDSEGKIVPNLNFTIDNMAQFTVEGIGDDAYIEVTKVFESGAITSGVYTFYFVANEDGYTTTTPSQDLSTALNGVSTEDNLKNIQVKVDMTTSGTVKPSLATSMLMSTEAYTAIIREGEVNKIGETNHIELIRAFAKAQLALKLADENTGDVSPNVVTKVTLNGSIPNSYYLIKGKENQAALTSSISPISEDITGDGNGTLFDAKANVQPIPFYISKTVYLPERYLTNNSSENALTYSITIDGDNNSYSAPIAEEKEDNTIDYNIKRNYAYTTIGTYDPATDVIVTFNWKVEDYAPVSVDVPSFN